MGTALRHAAMAMTVLLATAGCGKAAPDAMVTGDGIAANATRLAAANNVAAMAEAPAGNAASDALADAGAEADVRALVERVWGYYGKPLGAGGAPRFEAVMTPGLVAALKKQEDPEAGLGFDPFCACQDYEAARHTIRTVSVKGGSARVEMDFWTFGSEQESRRFTIELVRTPEGWRIDDIVTPDGGLREG